MNRRQEWSASVTRRQFLRVAAAGAALAAGAVGEGKQDSASARPDPRRGKRRKPVPLLHCTDLYHFPADPDDHWDLATAYALGIQGHVDLRAVIIDYCQASYRKSVFWVGDPGVIPVAQLNHITGLSVPCAVGSSRNLAGPDDKQEDANRSDRAASDLILRVLEDAPAPVAISLVGSCKEVALAANRAPDLFRRKCRGLYVVAGMATTDPAKGANKDTNVQMDPAAFRAMFQVPCPVYWTPCLEDMGPDWFKRLGVGPHSCYWRFRQADILSRLSRRARNYFLYALNMEKDLSWYRYLDGEIAPEVVEKIASQDRNMWSTAALIHAAGLTVLADGRLVERGEGGEEAVFGYVPVSVQTGGEGVKHWERDASSRNRFIFETRRLNDYQPALTKALGDLLSVL
jgi:hypothetical protein